MAVLVALRQQPEPLRRGLTSVAPGAAAAQASALFCILRFGCERNPSFVLCNWILCLFDKCVFDTFAEFLAECPLFPLTIPRNPQPTCELCRVTGRLAAVARRARLLEERFICFVGAASSAAERFKLAPPENQVGFVPQTGLNLFLPFPSSQK